MLRPVPIDIDHRLDQLYCEHSILVAPGAHGDRQLVAQIVSEPGRGGHVQYRLLTTDEHHQERATGLADTLGVTGVVTNPLMLATPHIAIETQEDDSLLVAQYDVNDLELRRDAYALSASTHGAVVPSDAPDAVSEHLTQHGYTVLE